MKKNVAFAFAELFFAKFREELFFAVEVRHLNYQWLFVYMIVIFFPLPGSLLKDSFTKKETKFECKIF
jgi:hypothetical protein